LSTLQSHAIRHLLNTFGIYANAQWWQIDAQTGAATLISSEIHPDIGDDFDAPGISSDGTAYLHRYLRLRCGPWHMKHVIEGNAEGWYDDPNNQ